MEDIEIARRAKLRPITEIAQAMGLNAGQITCYGRYMGKINLLPVTGQCGKLVLVTAMTSNAQGIGKTTVSIALADAMRLRGCRAVLALREPSLGPVFGIKGGATGGGMSQLLPMEEINLHFTGDFHAITAATNLLAAIVDNHIFQGNELQIDPNQIFVERCLDVNDRSLRDVRYQIRDAQVRGRFTITAASEVMAILALSRDLSDLKDRLGNIMVGFTRDGEPVYAKQLAAAEPMCILLKQALQPNLVQTIAGTPAILHCGPFANIAHGCNSIIATQTAMQLGDCCITEAGFGSDLGAEKFVNIHGRAIGKHPNAAVLVVTIPAILAQGCGDLSAGFANVKRHLEILRSLHLPCVVAINRYPQDTAAQLQRLSEMCLSCGAVSCICEAFTKGGSGCLALTEQILHLIEKPLQPAYTYDLTEKIETKIEKLARQIYGAENVEYYPTARDKQIQLDSLHVEGYYLNIAKTQFSISDDAKKLGAPKGYTFHVTDIFVRSGAKMIVVEAGNMLRMPGLGKNSAYHGMQIDAGGEISGLF